MALRARSRDLMKASASIMAQAREILAESGTIMILTDPRGVILRTEGDPATVDAARHIRLQTGAHWHERACGTNAIGTALVVGGPVQVHGAEHFCAGIKPWTCAATVVRDPADGDVLAVLDVSGLRGAFDRHALALAMTAAGRIEERLAGRELAWRHRLLEAGLGRLTRTAPRGVLVFDRQGRLVQTDARAGERLQAVGVMLDLKPDLRLDAFSLEDAPQAGEATLPEWLRPEWIEPVIEGDIGLGTLVMLPEAPRRGSGQRTPHAPATARASAGERGSLGPIIGHSAPFRQALDKARVLAARDVPVLLQGETGVGKEVFARAMHAGGPRQHGPFVALNCGGLPRDLLASELFGHERGAFTGALAQKLGRFELAHQGTLFLDEIGDTPLELQPKLLRVLQEQEFERLGSTRTRRVDVRLVAATNRDLAQLVEAGEFRADLSYRLHVFPILVPPLRQRPEDIPLLVRHFVRRYARQLRKRLDTVPAEAMEALTRYPWPGNVRQLQHVIERAVILSPGPVLRLLLVEVTPPVRGVPSRGRTLAEVDREHILKILRDTHGVVGGPQGAAARLGVKRTTLIYKMAKLGISRPPC
jgi:sigma-54 dependent transcriptional regulator, acetoin dehydrogenase operon transcriptional activator AcoR